MFQDSCIMSPHVGISPRQAVQRATIGRLLTSISLLQFLAENLLTTLS